MYTKRLILFTLTEIILMNPYTDKDAPAEKQSILDIKAKTAEGKRINIEMQLFNPYNMEKRTLFYWSEMYYHQRVLNNQTGRCRP
ncbi:hypothetical protein BK147_09760 [Paenibacillus sp. FSL R7-0337]|nr:hypothetical protein BK147_09760 [Paenibacillus sp. FSL R7-0337]